MTIEDDAEVSWQNPHNNICFDAHTIAGFNDQLKACNLTYNSQTFIDGDNT